MFALCAIENLRQLKAYHDSLVDEAVAIGPKLDVAQRMHKEASTAYFALTSSSDGLDAALVTTDYNTAVKNLVSICQLFHEKSVEITIIKQQIEQAELQLAEAAAEEL